MPRIENFSKEAEAELRLFFSSFTNNENFWLKAIKKRVEVLKSFSEKITFTDVANLKCLKQNGKVIHSLIYYNPSWHVVLGSKNATQGFFSPRFDEVKHDHDVGDMPHFHMWGINRDGKWVVVRVDYQEWQGEEIAKHVGVYPTDPKLLSKAMGVSLESIWRSLADFFRAAYLKRLELVEAIGEQLEIMELEELVVRVQSSSNQK